MAQSQVVRGRVVFLAQVFGKGVLSVTGRLALSRGVVSLVASAMATVLPMGSGFGGIPLVQAQVRVEGQEQLGTGDFLQANRRSRQTYWAATGLGVGHLNAFLTDNFCEASPQAYVACLEALSRLSQWVHSESIWVARRALDAGTSGTNGTPAVQTQGQAIQAERTWSDHGEFRWVQLRRPALPNATPAVARQVARQMQAQLQSATQETFSREGASALSFDRVRDELLGQLPAGVDRSALTAEVVNAYLGAFYDPHTYISPSQFDSDSRASSDESFVGIGVNLRSMSTAAGEEGASAEGRRASGGASIAGLFEGGPAAQAGLYVGDVLLEINDQNVSQADLNELHRRLRGTEGSRLTLKVRRGAATLNFTITRAEVVIHNITTKVLNYGGEAVGYIRLRSFGERGVCGRIASAVMDFQERGAKGLILDLRGNGGGLVSEAVCLGNLFVGPRQVIVRVRNLSDNAETAIAGRDPQLPQMLMVTLIDSGSASASEILAGALQDHRRSWILGERSFGKATVQTPENWAVNGITIWRTIQRFYQPSGRTNQLVGIVPDFAVRSQMEGGVASMPEADSGDDDTTGLREEDLYSNALTAQSASWQQTRPEAVARIRSCVNNQSAATARRIERESHSQFGADFRLMMAYQTLGCADQDEKRIGRRPGAQVTP